MSLTGSLARNTGVQIAGKIVSTAFGVVIIGMMTRYLGTAGFGAYSTATAYLQIFALLLDLGLNVTFIAMLGEHADDEAYQKRCISALYTLRIVMAVAILFVFAPFVAIFLPYPLEVKLAIFALTGSFVFPAINQIVIGVQQKHLRMTATAVAENIGRVIMFGGIVLAQYYHAGLVPIMWTISVAALANFGFNLYSTYSYGHFFWNWDPKFWISTLKRSWPVGLTIAFGLIYYKADTFILSLVRSQSETGLYGAAYRVLEILISVPYMYAGVLLPVLAHVWAKRERERMSHLITHSLEAMVLLIAPMVAGTIVLGTRIMTAVAGHDFVLSGTVIKILILAVAVIYLNTVIAHAIVAMDVQRKMIPVYAIVAIVTLAGYLWLIPIYGMWAAAWLTVFSEASVFVGAWVVTQRQVRFGFPWKRTVSAFGASWVMALCTWYVRDLWLPIPLVVAFASYGASLYAFGGISKDTIKELLAFRKHPTLEKSPL